MKNPHSVFGFIKTKRTTLIFFLIVSCTFFGFGQDTSATAQKQTLQYFKVEIGMNILDCPVLPPCLKNKLMTFNGIKDYKVDEISQSIRFNIPEGVITKEQIVIMSVGCSFPAKSVNVIVSTKPFSN